MLIVLFAAVSAFIAFGVSAYIFYNKWQPLRSTLESVILSEPVDIQSLTLAEASERLVKQVRAKKNIPITCVFSPPAIGDKRPITQTKLDGTAFFGVKALEESYECRAAFAGDRTILFTDGGQKAPVQDRY